MNADTSTLASLAQLVSGTQHLVVEKNQLPDAPRANDQRDG